MRSAILAAAVIVSLAAAMPAHAQRGKICQGGTGSPVLSVATTPTEVCAPPGDSSRYFWVITANAGTAGTPALACTDDGTTPSSTHFTFAVNGLGSFNSSPPVISNATLSCVSLTGSAVPITASAAQNTQP